MITRILTSPIRLPKYLSRLVDYFPVPDHVQELKLIRKAKKGHQQFLTWLLLRQAALIVHPNPVLSFSQGRTC